MELKVQFDELSEIIRQKTNKNVSFYGVNSQTVGIGYDFTAVIPIVGEVSKHLEIRPTFNRIVGNDVYLSQNDPLVNLAAGALHFLDIQSIVEYSDGEFVVHLYGIDKLRPILEKVHPRYLSFYDDGLILGFDMVLSIVS